MKTLAGGALTIRDGVLFGEDGWQFLYAGAHQQFEFLLSEQTPTEESVDTFWSNLRNRANYCDQRGLPYLHIVFPSKPVVMTRFLPEVLRYQIQSLYLRCYAHAGTLKSVLYPLDELQALDATELPFVPRNTHMTDLGCATVANLALERWSMAYDVDDHFRPVEGSYSCDLSQMLGQNDSWTGTVLLDNAPGLLEYDNRPFLPSNRNNVVLLHNPHSFTSKRLAVVGDSFFRGTLRFLSPVFRDILYLRGPGFHARTLDRFAPDAVMTGNAERYLHRVRPDGSFHDILAVLAGEPSYRPGSDFEAALNSKLSGHSFETPAPASHKPSPSGHPAESPTLNASEQGARAADAGAAANLTKAPVRGLKRLGGPIANGAANLVRALRRRMWRRD